MFKCNSDWRKSGNDMTEFEALTSQIAKNTEYKSVYSADIEFCYMLDMSDAIEAANFTAREANSSAEVTEAMQASRLEKYIALRTKAGFIPLIRMGLGSIPSYVSTTKEGFYEAGVSEEELSEIQETTKLLLIIDGVKYLLSPLATKTLLQRCNLSGTIIQESSLARTFLLKTILEMRHPKQIKLVIRTNPNGGQEVIAAHSENYQPIPQTVFADIISQVKDNVDKTCVCDSWIVDNARSSIIITFPQIAEEIREAYDIDTSIIPGIFIASSDSGDSSLIIDEIWKVGSNRYIYNEKNSLQHRSGATNYKDFIEKSVDTIFSQYTVLPEKICELIKINIPNRLIKKKIHSVLIQTGIKKMIGDSVIPSVEDALTAGFGKADTTAYDIAMCISQEIETILNPSGRRIEDMRKCCYKAFFAKYE